MRQIKVRNDVLHKQIVFLDYKNINKKKSQNLHFSQGVSLWFLSKIVIARILSFYSKYAK